MFALTYAAAELRRRRGRTLLTASGLGVGIGLVVAVSALSTGLDRAQERVLEPLTGVGADLSVTRPIALDGADGGAQLSDEERRLLEEENGGTRVGLRNLGDPGERFTNTSFMTTQLSFDSDLIARIAALDGVRSVAGSLTVSATTVSGRVPPPSAEPQARALPGGGGSQGGGPRNLDLDQRSVTGIDLAKPELAPVSAGQVTEGRFLSSGGGREAVLSEAYARRSGAGVGDELRLGKRRYTVVGLLKTPIGGQASDIYLELGELQSLSGKPGRVNALNVRADGAGAVADLERRIEASFKGASVTTGAELAERVGGSLADAKDLSARLGTALAVVALLGAFSIAVLLTLGSVAKRTRELGTLKALGWPQRAVVRQVTLESLAQGALGGVLGAALGVGAAALIGALGPTLEASVAASSEATGPIAAFGAGAITAGTETVTLDAPVEPSLLALAVALAVLGGGLAGAAGGLRAARLRPADALRTLD